VQNATGRNLQLSMSALQGVWALKSYRRRHPELLTAQIVSSLRRTSPDDAYHDYEAALELETVVDAVHEIEFHDFLRRSITNIIRAQTPWWLPLVAKGREKVRAALNSNEEQCFEDAKLFSSFPDDEVIAWWDSLATEVRALRQEANNLQGRVGEKLSLEYELRRLISEGITVEPRWIALDDNTAGYDILSYDSGTVEPVVKLIEVKTCSRAAAQFFLTTNEWRTALERSDHYVFHLWLLPEEKLIEFSPADIREHVPIDQGEGEWQDAVITVPLELFNRS
jgi:hypothetical protein